MRRDGLTTGTVATSYASYADQIRWQKCRVAFIV